MAQANGVAVSEVAGSGIGLAFVAFPAIISEAPAGALIGVLFFGSPSHFPNQDALRFILEEILPKLRRRRADVRVGCAGFGGTEHIEKRAVAAGIEMLGVVPDIAAEIDRASVVLTPVRSGRGIRIKNLEALSRGAVHSTFVETDRKALKAIEANSKALGADNRIAVRAMSAATLPAGQPFDLVLADPPYEPGSGTAVASAVAKAGWLAPGGWMAVETHRGDPVAPPEGWDVDAERDVGRARITILRA